MFKVNKFPKLLNFYVKSSLYFLNINSLLMKNFMKHLLLINNLNPNAVPGQKFKNELEKAFSEKHTESYSDDFDLSAWIPKTNISMPNTSEYLKKVIIDSQLTENYFSKENFEKFKKDLLCEFKNEKNNNKSVDDNDLEIFRNTFEEAQYDKDFKIFTHEGIEIQKIGSNKDINNISTNEQDEIKELIKFEEVKNSLEKLNETSSKEEFEKVKEDFLNALKNIIKYLLEPKKINE